MNFNIISMKQRAKSLMRETTPNPKLLGGIFAILLFAYIISLFVALIKIEHVENYLLLVLIVELIYMNFRNCCKWYALSVSREEKTGISDVFSAFKKKTVKIILLSIIKEILYLIGLCIFFAGVIFPVYWFRLSTYIIKDEDIGIFAALGKSMKLLKGHYIELIKLDISNIGWCALVVCTLGIAGLYVKPYTSIVYAEFYDYLKSQNEMFA